ncbi:hypothetical protein ACWXWU_12805 [Shewanella sp. A14]
MAKHGAVYCLAPQLQVSNELASVELVQILPDKVIEETLCRHHWILLKGVYKEVSDAIISHAQQVLAVNHG